jgi:hypothetical protein
MTPSSTAAANSRSYASRGRSDQTFSAVSPNNLANRSSSLCDAVWENGMSDGVDRLCGGMKSASASGGDSARFALAWRAFFCKPLPSNTISATICLACRRRCLSRSLEILFRCLLRYRRRSLRTPLPSPCWRRLRPERPRPEKCRPAAASPP